MPTPEELKLANDFADGLLQVVGAFGGGSIGGGLAGASLYVKGSGAAESTQTWNVQDDYVLTYARTFNNASCIISRDAGLTLSNYNAIGVHPLNQFVYCPSNTDTVMSWIVHAGDVVYFRLAIGGEIMVSMWKLPSTT